MVAAPNGQIHDWNELKRQNKGTELVVSTSYKRDPYVPLTLNGNYLSDCSYFSSVFWMDMVIPDATSP